MIPTTQQLMPRCHIEPRHSAAAARLKQWHSRGNGNVIRYRAFHGVAKLGRHLLPRRLYRCCAQCVSQSAVALGGGEGRPYVDLSCCSMYCSESRVTA
jgi:hypothetical protein